MQMKTIGENAGIVWRTLQDRQLSWEELAEASGLAPIELAFAVGWLAREGKITFTMRGETLYFDVYKECYY